MSRVCGGCRCHAVSVVGTVPVAIPHPTNAMEGRHLVGTRLVRELARTYGIVVEFVGPVYPLGHAPGCVPSSSRAAMFVHDRLASKAVPSHVKPAIAVDVTIMPAGSGLDATHVVVTVSSVRQGSLPERQAEGLCSPFSACATAAPAATQWAVPGGSGSEAAAAAAAAGLGGA